MSAEKYKRKLAVVLSASAEEYGRLMGEDEAATLQTLKGHCQVMCSLAEQHQGRVVDTRGDNLRNEELPKEGRMPFRIGIHLGDIIEEEGKIYGDGVNVAALLDSLADGGGICVSRSMLGVLNSWSGRYDEGIAEAERGVELDPNSGQAYFNLGVVLLWAGKSKEAIPVIQKALRLEPIPPDNYVQQLALVYFQTGDCKEALAACDKGLKRQPDHLVSRIIMADVGP